MEHKKPDVDPQIYAHIKRAIHEEWQAFLSLLRFQWPLVLLFVCGISTLLYAVQPFPPSQLRIATGQPHSSLEALGKQYATIFKKNGIQLELVPTAGAFENVELLKQGKVDAAFSLGGMVSQADAPELVSLGSVEYQPLWMFYRGPQYDGNNPTTFFKSKSFSINIPGSGTRNLTAKILKLHGISVFDNNKLLSMTSAESVKALLSGRIDGIFLVAGIESKTIQDLIADPKIHVFNFGSAQSYTKHLAHLETINLPRGAFSLATDTPGQGTQLVATTTTILTTEKLHPAIQHLFLSASKNLDHKGQAFFARSGGFPAYIERGVSASRVAERYYTNGPPALEAYAPFWLASFLDQIWVFLLAALAIGYPLLKVFPNYRLFYAKLCISDCFSELRKIDLLCSLPCSKTELQSKLDRFEALENRINRLWIPGVARDFFYTLKNAVEIARLKTERTKKHLEAQQS